jgi:hypothetical protein
LAAPAAPSPHRRFDSVDLLERPLSSENLDDVEQNCLVNSKNKKLIKSGDVFTLTTANPSTHPLPSFPLLEMQWHLNRIVSMSGAGEVFDHPYDNDDDVTMTII